MSLFVLLPGAGGQASWLYQRLVPELRERGHQAVPVDLPGPDDTAGLPEYTDITLAAIAEHRAADQDDDVVLVAQSLGGFTAPLVAARASLRTLVLLNAMIPLPHETAGAWWDATGATVTREENAKANGYGSTFDALTYFLHDVPPEYLDPNEKAQDEAAIVFEQPCPFDAWPQVPTRVLVGTDDRFFPADFQRRVAKERLGIDADSTPGGHCAAMAYPRELADRLVAYLA
jgi:pimeloyl-ACP methyl ester carboxylesterase